MAIAAEAGFDFIGARVRPVTATERALRPAAGFADAEGDPGPDGRHRGHGKDIEFLLLDGTDQREAWLAMMEAGQALGAAP